MAFRWWADDGQLIVVLGSSLPSSAKKTIVKVGPPQTKLSGPAHDAGNIDGRVDPDYVSQDVPFHQESLQN